LRERDELVAKTDANPQAVWNHPQWWIDRVRKDHPEQWQAILRANNAKAPLILRINIRKTTVAQYLKALAAMNIEAYPVGDYGVVMAAAVADFRPVIALAGKIKKDQGVPHIVLEATPDILAGLGATKPAGQVLVGFAAETSDLLANADAKLQRKHLDLIVANDVSAPGVGFAHDTNEVTLLRAGGAVRTVALTDKRSIAKAVLDTVVEIRGGAHTPST